MTSTQNVRIGDFCETGSGSTPSRDQMARYYDGGTIPWVKSGELRESIITSAEEHITETALKETSVKLVPANALLVAMYGATVGRLGILGMPATTNQAVCHIVPDPSKADVKYLFRALETKVGEMLSRTVGGAQPNINQGIVKDLRVALPPLEEQRRIAAILDQAETLRTQRRTALTLLDSLTQSLFLDMFGDPVANPKGWPTSPLADASDEIQIGPFGSLLHQEDYVPDGIPLINPMHIKDGKIAPGLDQGITQQKYDELPIYQLKAGDLVMGRRGEMGRCAIVTAEHGPLMCGTGSLYIRPNATTATATYLFHVLTSVSMKAKLEEFSLGATMPNLNKGIVAGLRVSLPPLPLQQTFATRIASIEALKTTHRRALAALDALFASLQQRAFAGQL